MITAAPRTKNRWTPRTGRFGGIDGNAIVLLGLICFLVLWSFWGDGVEEAIYDQTFPGYNAYGDVGVKISVSKAPGGQPIIEVLAVSSNSPAARAGLMPGDLIMGMNGRILSSTGIAWRYLDNMKAGETVQWTINRNGRNRSIHIHLNQGFGATGILRNKALMFRSLSATRQFVITLLFFKLSLILFYLLYRRLRNRTLIVALFAVKFVLIGSFLGVYNPLDAFFAIKFNTLSLLLGMSIITVVLNEAGFFKRVAGRISVYAGESPLRMFISFCLITYFFSLLVNNLTTILVVVPITLKLAATLKFDPRPLIVGEVVSSNLGGASTMVGDFPNMLIASQAGIGFGQFIIFLMPICLILLGLMLLYFKVKMARYPLPVPGKTCVPESLTGRETPIERRAQRRGLFVLAHVIFLFVISSFISLKPSAVALLGGMSLFLFSGIDRKKIMGGIAFGDILFFAGLFVVVGGLEASGMLNHISRGLEISSFGRPWLLCLVLMWSAALLTAFLNAGPTAALFFPVAMGCTLSPPHHIIWWALSLGILAGSSATVFGATAGPVSVTLLEKFSAENRLGLAGGNTITFRQFAETGVPLMLIFLFVSSIYVIFLCHYL